MGTGGARQRTESSSGALSQAAAPRPPSSLADDLSTAQNRLRDGWRPDKGTGKHTRATLLAVLAGSLAPDTGAVTRGHGVRVGHLGQESLPTGRPVGPAFGLLDDVDRPVTELSVGARRRLDLARVLADDPHVLLFDEPTNHLSARLVDELTEALEDTAAAVVLATHDRRLLRDTEHWPRLELG